MNNLHAVGLVWVNASHRMNSFRAVIAAWLNFSREVQLVFE